MSSAFQLKRKTASPAPNAMRDNSQGKSLREAQLMLAAIVESSEDAIISKTLDGVITSWNTAASRIFGYTEKEVIGRSIRILIPSELQYEENRILERIRSGERIEHYETIRITKTGKKVEVSLTISPVKDSSGKVIGCSKIARDITNRRLAEQALAELTRKLIQAQEQERARIARELHDDINQRIALIIVSLAQSELHLPGNYAEVRDRIHDARERLLALGKDVQGLSHRLHSSKLDYLGLATASRSLCREIAEQHKVEINFSEAGIPRNLSNEASLCLFRILQEGLHNAVKYSGVRLVTVALLSKSQQVQLIVKDQGVGFNPQEALKRGGLGLVSMRERVQACGGELSIDSHSGEGTTLRACIPISSNVIQPERTKAAG